MMTSKKKNFFIIAGLFSITVSHNETSVDKASLLLSSFPSYKKKEKEKKQGRETRKSSKKNQK